MSKEIQQPIVVNVLPLEDQVFTVAEACKLAKCSKAFFYRKLVAQKKIRISKSEGQSLVTGRELKRYITGLNDQLDAA